MNLLVSTANNAKRLFTLVLLSWLFAASVFALIEGVPFLDGLYWSMTTMSTVGYGDSTPATAVGKVFTMLFQAYSIFILVPMAVSNVLSRVNTSAYTHAEQEWMESSIKRIAARVDADLDEAPLDHEALS